LIFVIEASNAPEAEKEALYQLILSYVVRRMLCGLASKAYNNVFLKIAAQLRAEGASLAKGAEAFSLLSGDNMRFPDDNELRKNILHRKQYGSIQQARLRHILAEFELASRDKFDEATELPDDLTIEHVMPDAWFEHWPLDDDTRVPSDLVTGMSEAQLKSIAKREALKNTLGNLTLLNGARNPSLGHQGFAVKRDKIAKSLLKLNREIAEKTSWTESDIEKRGSRLAELAVKIWPSP
jgi:hypothetical protein